MIRNLIVVRGAGDLASGVIVRLHNAGFRVVALEVERPSAIRRTVSLCECIYNSTATLEGVTARRAESVEQIYDILNAGEIPVAVDPAGKYIERLKPFALVDAIIAKENLGTSKDMAQITVAVGPGFEAGVDVDYVIESMRGHNLGRVIKTGFAQENTGSPGKIAGYDKERVLHSPKAGVFRTEHKITDTVEKGEIVAYVDDEPVVAELSGIIRGLLRSGTEVVKGFKIGDIDPRKNELQNCFTISDKARCIAGGVLEAVMTGIKERKLNVWN